MTELGKVLKSEAIAYLRSGLLAPWGSRRIVEMSAGTADFGVLFVPGVGANASQFAGLKSALEGVVHWFDAFEYYAIAHPHRIARALHAHVEKAGERCGRLLVIGHSLGGVLLRLLLQAEDAPRTVAGFVSICAPLHGTWRCRLSLSPALRCLTPDGALVTELSRTAHRLDPLRGSILTVGVKHDSFITPYESAFLEDHTQLLLDDVGHVSSLFSSRVHEAVRALAERVATPG